MKRFLGAVTGSFLFIAPSIAQVEVTGPAAIIYKTRADYSQLVPVILSDDKSKIVAYPAPGDVQAENGFLLPVKLKKGYLLDNIGVGKNTAFIKLTYGQYAALSTPPTATELYGMIVDKAPFTELCDCGKRADYKDAPAELNKLIKKRKLKKKCRGIAI